MDPRGSTDASPVTECRCTTEIRVERFNFTWEIKNFSFCQTEVGQSLDSQTFSVGAKNETTWRLKVYPKGKTEESKDYLSPYATLVASTLKEARVQLRFYAVAANGQRVPKVSGFDSKVFTFIPGVAIGVLKFLPHEYLLNDRNGLLPGDKLTILCEGTVAQGLYTLQVASIGQGQNGCDVTAVLC